MLESPLLFSFLVKYNLFTSSLGSKALCIIINILVLRSICLSSSLVFLKNILKRISLKSILKTRLPMHLYLWWNFCCRSWFPEVFSFVWITFFFSFISACLMVSTSSFPTFSFAQSVLILSLFSNSIIFVISLYLLYPMNREYFSLPNLVDFTVPVNHRENKWKRKTTNTWILPESRKLRNMMMTVIPYVVREHGTIQRNIEKDKYKWRSDEESWLSRIFFT